jgi:hypothetical protein
MVSAQARRGMFGKHAGMLERWNGVRSGATRDVWETCWNAGTLEWCLLRRDAGCLGNMLECWNAGMVYAQARREIFGKHAGVLECLNDFENLRIAGVVLASDE